MKGTNTKNPKNRGAQNNRKSKSEHLNNQGESLKGSSSEAAKIRAREACSEETWKIQWAESVDNSVALAREGDVM